MHSIFVYAITIIVYLYFIEYNPPPLAIGIAVVMIYCLILDYICKLRKSDKSTGAKLP